MVELNITTKEIALNLTDGNNKEVVWYKKSYNFHINHKHVDIRTCKNTIPKAIKTPQLIFHDHKRKSVNYYYLERINYEGVKIYVKVVVDYNEKPAFIRTAHLTSNINNATIC